MIKGIVAALAVLGHCAGGFAQEATNTRAAA
jgi:hypothetical protein